MTSTFSKASTTAPKPADPTSLAEQSESIKSIWAQLARDNTERRIFPDPEKVTELPLNVILDFLIRESVALDRDKAKEIILKQIGEEHINDGKISADSFSKLFCKGMFKRALIKIAETFENQVKTGKISADLPLGRKLDTYQRTSMMKGIDPTSETYKDTRQMFYSLRDILEANDPDFMESRITYQEFLQDPFGLKKQQIDPDNIDEDAEYKTMLKFVDYTKEAIPVEKPKFGIKPKEQEKPVLTEEEQKHKDHLKVQHQGFRKLQKLMDSISKQPKYAIE